MTHERVVGRLDDILKLACSDQLYQDQVALVYDGFEGGPQSVTFGQLAITMTQVKQQKICSFNCPIDQSDSWFRSLKALVKPARYGLLSCLSSTPQSGIRTFTTWSWGNLTRGSLEVQRHFLTSKSSLNLFQNHLLWPCSLCHRLPMARRVQAENAGSSSAELSDFPSEKQLRKTSETGDGRGGSSDFHSKGHLDFVSGDQQRSRSDWTSGYQITEFHQQPQMRDLAYVIATSGNELLGGT